MTIVPAEIHAWKSMLPAQGAINLLHQRMSQALERRPSSSSD
jgi:hypothetical protein